MKLNAFYILLKFKYLVIINKKWMENYKIFLNIKKKKFILKRTVVKTIILNNKILKLPLNTIYELKYYPKWILK